MFRYRYLPNLFLGPNFERRTGTRSIQEERVTSHQWRAEVEQRLIATITAAFIGRYGLRLYNESFMRGNLPLSHLPSFAIHAP
jgi:hypothetical protein